MPFTNGEVYGTCILILLVTVCASMFLAQRQVAVGFTLGSGSWKPFTSDKETYWKLLYPGLLQHHLELLLQGPQKMASVLTRMPSRTSQSSPIVYAVAGFYWKNAPDDLIRLQEPMSSLALTWPPQEGQRQIIYANPFPRARFHNKYLNTLQGIFSLSDQMSGDHETPGWVVNPFDQSGFASAYFPSRPTSDKDLSRHAEEPAPSIFSCWGPSGLSSSNRSSFFTSFQWIEVSHVCYPLPHQAYPLCDDGGYWLYATKGSGIWWNTGRATIGLSKIERYTHMVAMLLYWRDVKKHFQGQRIPLLDDRGRPLQDFDANGLIFAPMPAASTTIIMDVVGKFWDGLIAPDAITFAKGHENMDPLDWNSPRLSPGDQRTEATVPSQMQWDLYYKAAKKVCCAQALQNRGSKDFFPVVWKAINKEFQTGERGTGASLALIFRGMSDTAPLRTAPSKPVDRSSAVKWSFSTFIAAFMAGLVAILLAVVCLCTQLLGAKTWPGALVAALAGGGLIAVAFGVAIERWLERLGWSTLSGAMEQTKLTVDQIWDILCNPYAPSGIAVSEAERNFLLGMSDTWVFDGGLPILGVLLGYDSIIMISQPNRTGTYATEILDLTHVRVEDVEKDKYRVFEGGLCGRRTFKGQKDYNPMETLFLARAIGHRLTDHRVTFRRTWDPQAGFSTCFTGPEKIFSGAPYDRGGTFRGIRTCNSPFADVWGIQPLDRDADAWRAWCTSADAQRLLSLSQGDSAQPPEFTMCDCIEREQSLCLSCKGHISDKACS